MTATTQSMSQPDNTPGGGPSNKYVRGPSNTRNAFARYETKPSTADTTGGGYPRWRSWEHNPTTPRRGKEDVYVSVHRLLAVVACYPSETPLCDVLDDLHGRDVHHNAPELPEDAGFPMDNRPGALEVLDHADHSSVTQSAMRAHAEDAKQAARDPVHATGNGSCPGCGRDDVDVDATSPGFDGRRCLECAMDECDGHQIEFTGGR
jgi:hypothetical protein